MKITFKEFLIERAKTESDDKPECSEFKGQEKIDCENCQSNEDMTKFLQNSTATNG